MLAVSGIALVEGRWLAHMKTISGRSLPWLVPVQFTDRFFQNGEHIYSEMYYVSRFVRVSRCTERRAHMIGERVEFDLTS